MQTLSYGYRIPSTGDFGAGVQGWFPAMELNIQRFNDHSHDGLNSTQLSSKSIVPEKQSILQAAFSNVSLGVNRVLVSLPPGMIVDNTTLVTRDPVTKENIFAKIEKFSLSQVYIYLNIVQDIEVYFLT